MELHVTSAKYIDWYEEFISSPSEGPIYKTGSCYIRCPFMFRVILHWKYLFFFFLLLEEEVGRNGLALGDHTRYQTFCCPSRTILVL